MEPALSLVVMAFLLAAIALNHPAICTSVGIRFLARAAAIEAGRAASRATIAKMTKDLASETSLMVPQSNEAQYEN